MDSDATTELMFTNFYKTVEDELRKAVEKFPSWPDDPVHAAGIIIEESGEVMKAVLEHVYEPHKSSKDDVVTEIHQTIAMCIRFLHAIDKYKWAKSQQHYQYISG